MEHVFSDVKNMRRFETNSPSPEAYSTPFDQNLFQVDYQSFEDPDRGDYTTRLAKTLT